MDSIKKTYTSFPFEWSVKSSSYKIRYRKAFDINVIDETFCSIINAKGNNIEFSELCHLLGFNLQDLAETDIFNIYLKGLTEYNLIEIDKEVILLTDFGQDALQSKLKYKYYFAATELLENQTATGESLDFSFKSLFDIENSLSHEREITKEIFDNPQLKQKLQLQLFGSDIYKGEIIELYQTDQYISYKSISLECEPFEIDNSFQLTIYKGGINKPDIQLLIDLPENEELKSKLIRRGMYHHILSENNSISVKDIETYIDLWNWKELAENPKTDWNDKNVFKLFLENGDGSVWSNISEKAPVESIKSVIHLYPEYWSWSKLTERFDNNFINEHIENYNWDFEEISYKETEFVISLLSIPALKVCDWDWNYLSKNLPDKFIEEHIEDFAWDFYEITVSKNEVFKNIFIKYKDKLDTLISKNWNWRFISEEINLNFLHKNISAFASKLDWHIVLYRLFNNAEIIAKCLKEESFKSLLKQYLPDNFVVAHQKYLWTTSLIDFFEQQNLIQWESKAYINGFDTNENVEWDNTSFVKYNSRITTEAGFLNVSKQISDYSLIEEFPDFAWNWEGVSKNKNLIDNLPFIESAFVGEFSFSNNLLWSEILSQSTFDVSFWNKNLESFNNATNNEKQSQFWVSLTQKEEQVYIFANSHFPWDWTFITENSTEVSILDSFDDIDLFEKWDWKIATRKLDKETILENIDVLSTFIDWEYLINEVYRDEIVFENQELKIAYRLSHLQSENRKLIWHLLTTKYPFSILFPIVNATYQFDVFEWDWAYISNHIHFPTDFGTLNRFKEKINWSVLSENNAIQQKFNPKSWNSGKEWFSNIDRYLQKFDNNWDWKVLSQNRNINYNRLLLQKYKGENWDWDYLTEFGGFLLQQKRDNEKYLEQILKQFPKIKFEILSNRKDIIIDSDLILSTKDKNWDWQILSENKKAEISIELILELKNKNWNWKAISQRKKIDFTNETFLQLLDKDWDWEYLSNDTNIEFNAEFIERTKSKPWNWKKVSRHKSFVPTIELLSLTKDFDLDWEYLSKHSGLNPTKELLAKFENKWDWHSITENPQINYTDIAFIERFADKWNWRFICESGKLLLNSQVLSQFKDHLEWDLISSNNNIDFTVEIIQEFKPFWNWTALKNNKRVEELLGNYVNNEINNSSTLNFIDRIEQQWSKWKGSIYHFSHIDNAVEIIKNRKIQSRNKATIKGDAAGNVVHLRNDAHDYARFYFRPHTPTQFYNEFLGKNTSDGYDSKNYGWVSWYEKARGLGFPKCPIPIFFRFSLQEVLFKDEEQCCISNGNMQTGSTQFGSIAKMINKFGFEDLYYTPQQYATKEDYNRYRNYAQQEFLVKDELSFNDLSDFEIVCPSASDRDLLLNLIGSEHKDIFTHIVVDSSYYNNENPRVRIDEEETELHISTSFKGSGYFVLNGTSDLREMEILSGDVNKIDKGKIVFNSYVSLGNVNQKINLNFIDESGRSWFVYAK
ncbi:MAG: DarT ssDNA thymidine ADP-ribosyltransferase family protein [Bacteroidota bacterium]